MEERRISRLYLANAQKRVTGLFGANFRRSPAFPLIILFIVLIIPGGLWYSHTHALFHKTKQKMGDEPQPVVPGGPGGREPLQISRTPSSSNAPEFTSAVVLPGLGLDLLQISANLPGRGNVPLLVAPTDQELVDGTAPRRGPNDDHGAIEVPWGGMLTGLRNILGSSLMLDYQGSTFTVPLDGKSTTLAAEGGLLLSRNADSATVSTTSGGAVMNGSFAESDFDGHWRSKSQVQVQVEVNASSLDLTTTVRNTGDAAEPMGIGWHPRFQIAGDRGAVELHLPEGNLLDMSDRALDLPSTKIVAPGESTARFMAGGQPLRTASIDEALVQLKPVASSRPTAEIRLPASGYGIRLTALSPSINELRVYAPANGNFISLGFQTNYDNPLAHTWAASDPAIVTLQPGQVLQYKVRLEIFPLAKK